MIYSLRCTTVCGFALLPLIAGCGRNGLMEIAGMVTYDGQPIEKGCVTFLPVKGDGPTAAAIVKDGKYAVRVAPGQKRVQIEGYKILGQRRYDPNNPASPMIDVQEQILPERYNAKSELTCEIVSTTRTYDFALKKR